MRFVDTNVLIYAVLDHPHDTVKRTRARSLLMQRGLTLSTQVVNEFYTQVTRPTRRAALPPEDAWDWIASLALRFPVQEISFEVCQRAWHTHRVSNIAYWDSLVIEAAREAGCAVVLSEDLSHGQDYGGVRVENPFLSGA